MFKKFLSYYKPHKKMLALVLSAVALYSLIELSLPIFTRKILNIYVPAGDFDAVVKTAIIMLALIFAFAILHYIVGFWGHMLGISIENDMRLRAFEKLQQLPFSYFDVNKTGVIMTRLTTDLHEVAELAHHGIEEALSIFLMLVLGYGYLIQLDFWVTTMLFMITFLLLGSIFFARRNMINAFRNLRAEHAEINSRLEGAISGVRLTRAFANEDFENEKFEGDNARYMGAYESAYKALGTTNAFNNFFVQALNVAVLLFGTLLVVSGKFTIVDMFTYFMYFNLLAVPIRRFITMLEQFQQGWAGFERYQMLMNEPLVIEDSEHPQVLENVKGDIVFDQVAFKYEKDGEAILKSLDITVESGNMVALVGPSGVGKTTIAQLIPRFYEIDQGSITIDGLDIREIELKSLRSNIGYVQQDVVIFWGTIADNIGYGKPGASMEEIIEAAKAADIHEFIESLPKGYDTMVGERGVMLSGGQKQRISLSRIFLKDPKILILDEATSALDNITEAYVQKSIEKLTIGRTVLVVAHRLSTVRQADEIIVLGEEGIVQRGRHDDLVNRDGHYRTLYEASQNGVLADEIEE